MNEPVNSRPSADAQFCRVFIAGSSRHIQSIREQMKKVAGTDANVLILGESGTGKELIARGLHKLSRRETHPFVPLNCGAIPAELFESELFGHVRGAFTGAIATRKGRFELAEKGTLFLDEIGDMNLPMQVKLLRVLQERCFERVGSETTQNTDVRIIAATHRNLEQQVEDRSFREDLYYRLNVFPIYMPPLRERQDDIAQLVEIFAERIRLQRGVQIRMDESALAVLKRYHWPGNVRELENLVERLSILFPDHKIHVGDLPEKYRMDAATTTAGPKPEQLSELSGVSDSLPQNGIDLKCHLESIERTLINQALGQTRGVVSHAARLLGLRRTTLVEKLRKYDALTGNVSQNIDMFDHVVQ
jgi:sigma-54 specific flagellar transcriptional regulator A